MAPQILMEKSEMRTLLKRATPTEPIRFAFGKGEDSGTALLLMDKLKQPRALETEIKKQAPAVRDTRFGDVFVDEAEPDTVKFKVNKAITGMAKRLSKTIKGSGFKKVVILTEDGSPLESHVDEEEGQVAPGTAPQQTQAPGAPPPPPPQQQDAPKPDLAALQRALAELIPRIPGVVATNPEAGEALKKLAGQANVYIKTNNPVYAANAIEQLRRLLEASQTPAGPTEQKSAYDKPRQIWIATHQKIRTELEGLRTEIRNTYKDSEMAGEIDTAYQNVVGPFIEQFDMRIADRLTAAEKETNAEQKAALVAETKAIIASYQRDIEDELVTDLDANPFKPLALQKTLAATLTALAATIR